MAGMQLLLIVSFCGTACGFKAFEPVNGDRNENGHEQKGTFKRPPVEVLKTLTSINRDVTDKNKQNRTLSGKSADDNSFSQSTDHKRSYWKQNFPSDTPPAEKNSKQQLPNDESVRSDKRLVKQSPKADEKAEDKDRRHQRKHPGRDASEEDNESAKGARHNSRGKGKSTHRERNSSRHRDRESAKPGEDTHEAGRSTKKSRHTERVGVKKSKHPGDRTNAVQGQERGEDVVRGQKRKTGNKSKHQRHPSSESKDNDDDKHTRDRRASARGQTMGFAKGAMSGDLPNFKDIMDKLVGGGMNKYL